MEGIRSFQVYGWPCFIGNGMYLLSSISLSKGFEVFSCITSTILVMSNFFMVKPTMRVVSAFIGICYENFHHPVHWGIESRVSYECLVRCDIYFSISGSLLCPNPQSQDSTKDSVLCSLWSCSLCACWRGILYASLWQFCVVLVWFKTWWTVITCCFLALKVSMTWVCFAQILSWVMCM